ncbi:sporulation protein [Thioalkalivibrio denitrificans]|uniref:Sporulation protein n=1 Tax=Thioalkalivibrio denitrificans TaxID=108003 RepID=A0A1V3NUM9_9GAMM|nr:SPOR domain-containing protein [Thioalkalivibrio denitrificans]OOG28790.1 sporulation protein [Thioalkalivibrio denitrificans]
MRSLALLLILLNVAFFYWHTAHQEPAPHLNGYAEVQPPSGVARLVLLDEREAPEALPETQPREAPEPAVVAVPALICETVGPLAEREAAEALQAALEEQGAAASLRTASREVPSTYWVYLPPRSSREAAQDLARSLTELGVEDLYVMGEGDFRHGLSLGLFSEHERARRRVRELEALGYSPQIEARFRTQTVYWLDLAVPADRVDALDVPETLGRMQRPCPGEALPQG